MPSQVRAFQPVAGDPPTLVEVFEDDPATWLPQARRDGAVNRWLVVLHASALNRTVRLEVGAIWRAGSTRWRNLSWVPVGAAGDATPADRLLPSFSGELGLHAEGTERATLALDGHYEPPGGRFGQAVDTIALRRLAQITVNSLVAAIAGELTQEAEVRSEQQRNGEP